VALLYASSKSYWRPRRPWRTAVALVVFVSAIATTYAASILNGIEPGVSTRAQAEKVFGAPIRSIAATRFAYEPTGGTSGIEIEYTPAQVVDRIELAFAPGLAREVVVRDLNLPSSADGTETTGNHAVEYYGGNRTLVFTHESASLSSAVSHIGYCSRTVFDSLTAAVVKRDPAGPVPAAVQFSNAEDKPVIRQFNPNACQDIYQWAQLENDAVRRGRNAPRREAILDVMITAQKGDCPRAQELSAAYKKAYADAIK